MGETTFIVALVEIKVVRVVEVPNQVISVLEEFPDVMPPNLPRTFSPRHAVHYKIELESGEKPLAQALY